MSAGAETFVLARRGLPLAARSRRPAPAPWFASFAFPQPRVCVRFDALPGPDAEPSEPSFLQQGDLPRDEPFPDQPSPDDPLGRDALTDELMHLPTHARARTEQRQAKPEPRSAQHVEAPATLPSHAAAVDRDRAAPPIAPDETTPYAAPTDEPAFVSHLLLLQPVMPPMRDVPDLTSEKLPALASPVSRPGMPSAREVPERPGVPRPRTQQSAEAPIVTAGLPTREASLMESASPPLARKHAAAPARVSMAMGAPPAALRGEPGPAAPAAATTARRRDLAHAARVGHRPISARIGTLHVVVRTQPPAPRSVLPAPGQPIRDGKASAERPAERPFRNPWASSRWRGD